MSYTDTYTSILLLLPGLPQTSTDAKFTETVNLINSHRIRADNIINSTIAKRYDVTQFTSTSIPPLLKTIAEDITAYMTFISLYSADNQNRNEWIEKYETALDTLKKIRDGELDLVDSSGNIISERKSSTTDWVSSSTEEYTTFFNIDSATNWAFDTDLLNDVSDERK